MLEAYLVAFYAVYINWPERVPDLVYLPLIRTESDHQGLISSQTPKPLGTDWTLTAFHGGVAVHTWVWTDAQCSRLCRLECLRLVSTILGDTDIVTYRHSSLVQNVKYCMFPMPGVKRSALHKSEPSCLGCEEKFSVKLGLESDHIGVKLRFNERPDDKRGVTVLHLWTEEKHLYIFTKTLWSMRFLVHHAVMMEFLQAIFGMRALIEFPRVIIL